MARANRYLWHLLRLTMRKNLSMAAPLHYLSNPKLSTRA